MFQNFGEIILRKRSCTRPFLIKPGLLPIINQKIVPDTIIALKQKILILGSVNIITN